MKTLLAALVAALVLGLAAAPAALADGPPDYASVWGAGVARGMTHYVAVPGGPGRTMLAVVKGGRIDGGPVYEGYWGIPTVAYNHGGGLSHDGRTLFLQSAEIGDPTRFLVVSTRTFKQLDRFTLHGNFSFDALSPDASRLYLIQRVDANDYSRYVVRSYDVRTHRLLPGRVADRTQRSWVMQGSSTTRTQSADGRWVYTLYTNPGGYPFIHALDTVRGVAHCIGLPWPETESQDAIWRLQLRVHGGALDVRTAKDGTLYRVSTSTWAVAARPKGGFAWEWLLLALAALPAMELARRRRRITPVSVQGGSDVPTARPRARRVARLGSGGLRRRPVSLRGTGR
jgi:hypothetical protein